MWHGWSFAIIATINVWHLAIIIVITSIIIITINVWRLAIIVIIIIIILTINVWCLAIIVVIIITINVWCLAIIVTQQILRCYHQSASLTAWARNKEPN